MRFQLKLSFVSALTILACGDDSGAGGGAGTANSTSSTGGTSTSTGAASTGGGTSSGGGGSGGTGGEGGTGGPLGLGGTGGFGGAGGVGGGGGAGGDPGCASPADCPGTDSECQTRTCVNGVCGLDFTPLGTPVTMQTAGDCRSNECDGMGGVGSFDEDADIPDDGVECTVGVCTMGMPSQSQAATGAPCGTGACTAAGICAPTITLVRVGSGAAALTSASTATFLHKYWLDGTEVVFGSFPLAMPTSANGNNRALTLSGTSTFDGGLTRSENGAYLLLPGYDAAPGVAGIQSTTSMTVNRVIGRVDSAGNVDTSTRFDTGFSAGAIRGATSSDGTTLWASGNGGVWAAALGSLGGTQILSTPSNVRWVNVFGGQLFGDSGSNPFTTVFAIGSGLPTTAGQTAAIALGLPTSGGSPVGFALFDRDGKVPGLDTLYLADDRSTGNGGGIQKWTFDGVVWSLAATFTSGPFGVRGLAAETIGGNVTLVGVTTANEVVVFVDIGAFPMGAVILTPPTNTAFRGVAFSAH